MAIGKTFKFGKKLINISGRGIATKDTATGEIRRHPYPWARRPARPAAEDDAQTQRPDAYDDTPYEEEGYDEGYAPTYDDAPYDGNPDENYDQDDQGYEQDYEEPSGRDGRAEGSHSLIDQTWFMFLMLVVLPPLGIWLLWRSNKFEITAR